MFTRIKTLPLFFLIFALCGFFSLTVFAADDTPEIDPALELIHALGCKGCHTISGDGGTLATDLSQTGSRWTVKQLEIQLTTDPATREAGFMPSYSSLPNEDLHRVSEYLYNLQ